MSKIFRECLIKGCGVYGCHHGDNTKNCFDCHSLCLELIIYTGSDTNKSLFDVSHGFCFHHTEMKMEEIKNERERNSKKMP